MDESTYHAAITSTRTIHDEPIVIPEERYGPGAGIHDDCHRIQATYRSRRRVDQPQDLANQPRIPFKEHLIMRIPMTFWATIVLGGSLLFAPEAFSADKENSKGSHAGTKDSAPHHPLLAALQAIRTATEELKDASHDFGGHKNTALDACQKAERALLEAITAARKRTPNMDDPSTIVAKPIDAHGSTDKDTSTTTIRASINALDKAQHDMRSAPGTYDGRKDNAMTTCRTAEQELRNALGVAGKSK